MKKKNVLKFFITSVLALVLLLSPFMLQKIDNDYNEKLRTTKIEATESEIDHENVLSQFEDSSMTKEDSTTIFVGYQTLNLDEIGELDEVSETNVDNQTQARVKYTYTYNEETNLVTLKAQMEKDNEVVVDEIVGFAFVNENGEIDAVLDMDGEEMLLSELQSAGMIENCGWFKNLAKKIKKSVVAKVVVAVVAVVAVSAVASVVASVVAGATMAGVVATGAVAGAITGGIAGGGISYEETGKVQFWAVLAGVAGGAAIGATTGLGVYKAAAALKISKALKGVDANKKHHILQSKHNWNKVGNGSWNDTSKAIDYTLKNGTSAAYKTGGQQIVSATYKGETVQVVTKIIDKVLRIVDAWVI